MKPGTLVEVAPHNHATGPCFAHGWGIVKHNHDIISREKKEIIVEFGSLTVRFPEAAYLDGQIQELR